MIYAIITSAQFDKAFKKLDKSVQQMINIWIEKNIQNTSNPRLHGKPLVGNKVGWWRYRVGDYRILADIQNDVLTILLIDIGRRSKVHKD